MLSVDCVCFLICVLGIHRKQSAEHSAVPWSQSWIRNGLNRFTDSCITYAFLYLVYYTENVCVTCKPMGLPLFETGGGTHPSTCSDWPLHTHRSHLSELSQSVLRKDRKEVFYFWNAAITPATPPSHWLHTLDNEEKQHYRSVPAVCCFSSHTLRHGRSSPYQVFNICGSARCCCPPSLCLTAERSSRKVTVKMEETLLQYVGS